MASQLFAIIDRNEITAEAGGWNGGPLTLRPAENANLPATSDRLLAFSYLNRALANNQGSLALTSVGEAPGFLQAFAPAVLPGVLLRSFDGRNLSVTNISADPDTPISIAAVGIGLPGLDPVELPADGTPVVLPSGAEGKPVPSAAAEVPAGCFDLAVTAPTALPTVVVLFGSDHALDVAWVVALNAPTESGPNTGVTPPPGYYATTRGCGYALPFCWEAQTLLVANLSSAPGASASLALHPLHSL